ncbi:MAG: DUF1822 family protein [Cyanobacteria bacterium J06555_13]
MINSLMQLSDFRLLYPELVWLEPDKIEAAVQLSNQVYGEAHQWSVYLHGLALAGFEQWFTQRSHDTTMLDIRDCSIFTPSVANLIASVCNLKINDFRLCIIATESVAAEAVSMPCAVVDSAAYKAHLYVLAEVIEEQSQVVFRGILSQEQLSQYKESSPLQPTDEWHYTLPLWLFDQELDQLLFYAKHLEPADISAEAATVKTHQNIDLISSRLSEAAMSLPPSEHKPWELLSWEEGRTILDSQPLTACVYEWQAQSTSKKSLRMRIQEIFSLVSQSAIDTAQWAEGQLSEAYRSMGYWNFSTLASARTLELADNDLFKKQLTQALDYLRAKGRLIPADVYPVCKDVTVGSECFRLCTVVFSKADPDEDISVVDSSENQRKQWFFLVILGAVPPQRTLHGAGLRVSTLNGVVKEAVSEVNDPFVYALIDASSAEKVSVTIETQSGTAMTLPPYIASQG